MRRSDSILHNSLLFFIARAIDLFSGMIGFVLVARILGVEGFGRYNFVTAFITVLGVVVNLGMDHIIIRELARDRNRLPVILGAAIKLKSILLAAAIPLLIGGFFVFDLDSDYIFSTVYLFTATLFLREFFTVLPQAVFLALEKLEYRTYTTIVFQILRLGGVAGALLAGYGLKTVFATCIIADAVQAGLAMWILKKKFAPPDYSAPISEISYIFKQALSLGIAYAFVNAFMQMDILLLKSICGDYESGLFASAYKFTGLIIQIVIPVVWVLLPHLTRAFNFDRDSFLKENRFYLKIIAAVMFPSAVILGLYSHWMQVLFFGKEFYAAGLAMTIVAPTLIFRGLGYLFDLSFTAVGKQKMTAIVAASAFFVKLILELLLIPHYKHLGAAYGTLGAELIAFIVSYLLLSKYVGNIRLLHTLWKPLLAGAVTFIFLYLFLRSNAILGMTAGIIVFYALTLIIGTFDRWERTNILALLERKAGKIPGLSRMIK